MAEFWTREERERFSTCTGERGQHSRDAELCPLHEMAEVGTEEVARILATVEAQREATRALLELIDTDDRLDDRCLGCNVDAGECREGCEVEKARALLAALDPTGRR